MSRQHSTNSTQQSDRKADATPVCHVPRSTNATVPSDASSRRRSSVLGFITERPGAIDCPVAIVVFNQQRESIDEGLQREIRREGFCKDVRDCRFEAGPNGEMRFGIEMSAPVWWTVWERCHDRTDQCLEAGNRFWNEKHHLAGKSTDGIECRFERFDLLGDRGDLVRCHLIDVGTKGVQNRDVRRYASVGRGIVQSTMLRDSLLGFSNEHDERGASHESNLHR